MVLHASTTTNDNQDSGYHAAKVDIASEFSTAERVAKFHFEGSFLLGRVEGMAILLPSHCIISESGKQPTGKNGIAQTNPRGCKSGALHLAQIKIVYWTSWKTC